MQCVWPVQFYMGSGLCGRPFLVGTRTTNVPLNKLGISSHLKALDLFCFHTSIFYLIFFLFIDCGGSEFHSRRGAGGMLPSRSGDPGKTLTKKEVASGSATPATSSSRSTATAAKKMFGMTRTLTRRVSDGERPTRNLQAEFEHAAAMHVDKDDDELIPDEVAPAPDATESGAAPAQVAELGFWQNMDALMDRKTETIKTTVLSLNDKIDGVHDKLLSTIADESKERKEAQKKVDEAMEAISMRLTRLETNDNYRPESKHFDNGGKNDDKQNGWQPQHIILGGRVGNHPRQDVEEQANERLTRQPPSIIDHILPPYCPRRYGNIVTFKDKKYDDLQRSAFDITKA